MKSVLICRSMQSATRGEFEDQPAVDGVVDGQLTNRRTNSAPNQDWPDTSVCGVSCPSFTTRYRLPRASSLKPLLFVAEVPPPDSPVPCPPHTETRLNRGDGRTNEITPTLRAATSLHDTLKQLSGVAHTTNVQSAYALKPDIEKRVTTTHTFDTCSPPSGRYANTKRQTRVQLYTKVSLHF